MQSAPLQLPPTPTEHWLVDQQHRLHLTGANAPGSADCLARGTAYTTLGYGSLVKSTSNPDALEQVLNVLETRYPNHRWFIER